jgi:hypothetical protein
LCEASAIQLRTNYQFPEDFRQLVMILLSLFTAAAVGCGERGSGPKLPESNLRLVAVLYSQYLSAHGGEAPADAADFRAFIQSLGPGVLKRAGLSGLDELLVSRRDGHPFALKYKNGEWALARAIAYEQKGAGGTRYLATNLGSVSEITEEQFQKRLNETK